MVKRKTMSHYNVMHIICRGFTCHVWFLRNGCDAVIIIQCQWSVLRNKQTICVIRELQQLPTSQSLSVIYIQTFTGTRAWGKSALFVSCRKTLAALCSECAFVSLCGPHRADSPRKGDGTVASGETDGRSVQGGVKGRREGKDGEEGGECLNMQPLWVDGQWHPKHFLPLPPSKGTCC